MADRRDAAVVRVLGDDDLSAAGKRERKDFDELIRLIEADAVDVVIAWSMDRLLRNRRDTVRLIEACQEHNVDLWLVRGSDLDMQTPAGRMMADVLAGQARYEIEVKADRMDRALRQAAEAGRPPKRRAFGYRPDGVAIDPIEGPAVAEAYARLLAGGSIVGITRSLNERELWTTGGKAWTGPAVRVMLRNPRNAAIRQYRGQEVGPGQWPPIVSEEVYRAAVSLLADPSRKTTTEPHARKHLGAALYLCGRCAEDGTVTTMATGYRAPDVNGNKARLYRCRLYRHVARKADPVDDYVRRVIAEVLRRKAPSMLAETAPDLSPLRTEASALRQRLAALADDIELPETVLKRRVRALETRLAEVNDRLAEAGRASALASVASAPDPGEAWLELDDVAARQAVVRELATVTLLPAKGGRRGFDPDTVAIVPREAL